MASAALRKWIMNYRKAINKLKPVSRFVFTATVELFTQANRWYDETFESIYREELVVAKSKYFSS